MSPSPATARTIPVRRRNPILLLIVSMLTQGWYGFVWALLIMRDANRLRPEAAIPVRRLAIAIGTLAAVSLAAMLVLSFFGQQAFDRGLYPWLVWSSGLSALAALALEIYGLLLVGRSLRQRAAGWVPAPWLIVLTGILGIAPVLLQYSLNTEIRAHIPPTSPSL
jgi:hypothetical protein